MSKNKHVKDDIYFYNQQRKWTLSCDTVTAVLVLRTECDFSHMHLFRAVAYNYIYFFLLMQLLRDTWMIMLNHSPGSLAQTKTELHQGAWQLTRPVWLSRSGRLTHTQCTNANKCPLFPSHNCRKKKEQLPKFLPPHLTEPQQWVWPQ